MKKILILSDVKDYASRMQRKDFADGNGRLFWFLLHKAGINTGCVDIRYCRNGEFDTSNYAIVVPLGQEALNAVGHGNVRKIRGSVIGDSEPWIIPTLHPRDLKKPFELFREAQVETSQLVLFDLQKVQRIYENGFEKPRENFTLDPTINDLENFVQETKEFPYIGVDIEATGLNLDYADIVTIGFAVSRTRAFVCPLRTTNGDNYWRPADLDRVNAALKELLLNRKLIFQNGYGYDVPLLRRDGYNIPWENFLADTMLMHHALDPELPHNIGFISSVWGNQPYWKDSIKDYLGEAIYLAPDIPGEFRVPSQQDMRRYNARDCTALIDIYESMLPELEARNVKHISDLEHKLIPAVITMRERGLVKDETKLKTWQSWLSKELNKQNDALRNDFDLPEQFNFNSQDHLNWLLYGQKSSGLEKKLKELESYEKEYWSVQYECSKCCRKKTIKVEAAPEAVPQILSTIEAKCPNCRQSMPFFRTALTPKPAKSKSKDTQKYKELSIIAEILAIDPLTSPKSFRPSRTASGKYGTGSADIARFANAVLKRQVELDGQKRPNELEIQGLSHTSVFLERYRELAKSIKLRAAFFDLPTGIDGNIHPTVLIQGTATGRFSCINPNAQQMPNAKSMAGGKVRNLFRAPRGASLISVDFSNLEVQTGARFMEDQVLLGQLEKGLNIHDENTRTFFGVDKDNPRWSILRAVSKIIQFGRLFYGGSNRGIYNQVLTKVPDSGLEFSAFETAVGNYFAAHPDFDEFVQVVQYRAKNERLSTNGFGRVRRLYSNAQSITRQALNSPIQGTAADFVNNIIVRLWDRGLGNKYRSYIALQIHDELLFVVYDDELEEVSQIIHEEMTAEQEIKTFRGNKVSFSVPIDAEIGINWGTMEGFDLLTGKHQGGSKH